MKNNGKTSKTKENEKTNEVANEKKHENLNSKLQILTPNQEIFKNSRKLIFIILSFFLSFVYLFFHFPCPWHLKSRKTMKINENTGKPSKTKENEKTNEVANEKA